MGIIRTDRPKPSEYFKMQRELKYNKFLKRSERKKIIRKLNERRKYLSSIAVCQVWMCEQEDDEEVYTIESKGITEKTRPMLVSMCHGDNITVYPLTTSENATGRCKIYHRMWDGSGICLTEQLKAFTRVKFWFYMNTIDFRELEEINNQYAKELLKSRVPTLTKEATIPSYEINMDRKLVTTTEKRTYSPDIVKYIVDNWSLLPMNNILSVCKGLNRHDVYNIANANFGTI